MPISELQLCMVQPRQLPVNVAVNVPLHVSEPVNVPASRYVSSHVPGAVHVTSNVPVVRGEVPVIVQGSPLAETESELPPSAKITDAMLKLTRPYAHV